MKSQNIIYKNRVADQQIAGENSLSGAAPTQAYCIPQPNLTEGKDMRQPAVAALVKQNNQRRRGKKKKVVTRINLPEAVVKWIDNTFQEKERNTAYKYAFAAHLQVNKIVQRKNYGYICLPKSTLAKYITDKKLCSIKKRFAECKIIYHKGSLLTPNKKWMYKYSFNEEMFLSRLVKVETHSFESLSTIPLSTQQIHEHNKSLPLSYGEGEGVDMKGVYMWRNLLSTGQSGENLITKKHKTMKKEISYEEVLRLKNQGFTHEQIGVKLDCSTKKVQRVLKEHEVDKVDSEFAGNSMVDSGQWGKAAVIKQVDSGQGIGSSANVIVDSAPQGNVPDSIQETPGQSNPVPQQPISPNKNLELTKQEVEEFTLQNLQSLHIDFDKLNSLIPARIESAINSIKVISQYQDSFHIAYKFIGNDTTYRGNIFNVLREKVKGENSLIKYKDKYYIGNLNEFKEQKRKEIEFSLKQSLQSVSNPECYRAHINDTNGRLDSTLTNLWGEFKGQILHDNDCCEIDIVNSQMAFLASHLKCASNYHLFPDVMQFILLAEGGIIYEYVADRLKIDRNAAKQILFHVLFSNYKTNDISVFKFKQLFPTIHDYICKWKKANGSNCFSIMLQKMESKIMINSVLKELIRRNIFCLTIHDSVICRKGEVKQVMDLMQSIFKENNFKCQLFSKYWEMEKGEKKEGRNYYPDAPNQAERILTEEDLTFDYTEEEMEEMELLWKQVAEELNSKKAEAEKAKVGEAPETEMPNNSSYKEINEAVETVIKEDEDEFEELIRWWAELE